MKSIEIKITCGNCIFCKKNLDGYSCSKGKWLNKIIPQQQSICSNWKPSKKDVKIWIERALNYSKEVKEDMRQRGIDIEFELYKMLNENVENCIF